MAPKPKMQLLYENQDAEHVGVFQKKGYRTSPILFVNGERVPPKQEESARPNQTLLSFLRDTMKLTGSKLGCAEGGCGACTVMLSKATANGIQHVSVNACLMPILAADGCHITTVEGIGSVKGGLHPVQQAMVEFHGSQCGFCTPGIIVSLYTLISNHNSVAHLEEHLDGNLCRCTGYRPIWDAGRSLCGDAVDVVKGPCGTPCRECPERETCEQDCNVADKEVCSSSSADKMKRYKDTVMSSKEWLYQPNEMFPKELLEASPVKKESEKPLVVVDTTDFHAGGTWFKPTSFVDMLELLNEYDNCKIVVGNTEVGIETRFKHAVFPRLICPSESISELYGCKLQGSNLEIGSCCPLSVIQQTCLELGKQPNLARTVMPIHDMLRWFASTQIRNVACLGGNLVTASPISDMNPMLASLGAVLVVSSFDGSSIARRTVKVSEFFLKYRTVDLKPNEVVEKIEVPVTAKFFEYVRPFKQARRREDDISIVTSGQRIKLEAKEGKWMIADIALSYGGMAPTTIMATETMKFLKGNELTAETFEAAADVLLKETSLPENVPGGQAAFRMTLAASFLHKFYLSILEDLKEDLADPNVPSGLPPVPLLEQSETGLVNFLREPKPSSTGVQTYPKPKVASGLEDKMLPTVKTAPSQAEVVGKTVPHASGPLHCTGEALYTDDIPLPEGTLQAALVLASECGGVFKSLDSTKALAIPGVVGVYAYNDLVELGGDNALGAIVHDELVFLPVGEKVKTVGQVLGIVVAETLESAEVGARSVEVELGAPDGKVVVTIDDAIEVGSFYDFARHTMERGDKALLAELENHVNSEKKPALGDIVCVSGSFRSGHQEHFYLETNSTLVVPSESDTNLTVYVSTQAPTKTQTYCASATGTPASKVVVRMKRMGGGFGGKETRSVFASAAVAVAAKAVGRPVRLTLARDIDMKLTGTRHAFVSTYKASARITEDGAKLVACDMKLFANGGCGFDLSGPVVDRALFHSDGCYYYPNFRAEGVPCKTVQPPHTAFRGFGGPQGLALAEHIMDHLSIACSVPGDELRRMNMYETGDVVPFGMIMGEGFGGKWHVPSMWDDLSNSLGVPSRRLEIQQFNSANKWTKRGLCLMPTKFGIAFTAKYMNQGGALVHVYTDGTVLVSIGGTEMGQGLFTKVCQVAAQAFGIPLDDVYCNDSSTDKVANTIPTAASMSTDMYGMATLDACRQIIKRIEPIREKLGADAAFKAVAKTAHFARLDLSAHGFFALDDSRCGYDWAKERPADWPEDKPENSWKGNPFNYFTQGVVCTEVEVDVLSGNHKTLRSDVVVDVGSSINPMIDIGQIEGAFTQGAGWSTIEETIYSCDDHTWVRPRGAMFTTGPGTYKIPAFNDVPEIFNVSLLPNADNPFAVHSSKAIGEPPFFLGASVFYAIKDAVTAARKQNLGSDEYFEMRMPATSERIRMYCADALSSKAVTMVKDDGFHAKDFQPQGTF